MAIADHVLDPGGMWDDLGSWAPLGFIDLATWPDAQPLRALPPFPVIGLGDPAHPLARQLDAVIEPPVSAEAILREVLRNPHAAAVAVQVLRTLQDLPVERALPLESLAYGALQGSAEHAAWRANRPEPTRADAAGGLMVARYGSTLRIVLDRPAARNAIDRSLRDALSEAFDVAAIDPDVRRIELRATSRAFSVGADLAEFGTTRDPAAAHLIRQRTLPALKLVGRFEALDVHVQGPCIGAGLELAAFAGRMTAAPCAWFQLPELAMGLIPGAGGCVSLPRRIGRQRTALMILSGRRIGARTALDWGLIDAIANEAPADQCGAHVNRI